MSARRLSVADYTVACICPMGVEAAPVKAMLEEIHAPLSFARDSNAYILGKIGGHNVVVAVMPEIGNNAAAVVATQLLNDFPAVRFGLLVGIGGGVPGDADVRLGDVVVGQPTGTSSGVVQYDMGKKLTGGGFQRTGALNKPPEVLSATVRKLDAEHRLRGNSLSSFVSEMIAKIPFMQSEYSRPTTDQDLLFRSSYSHRSGPTCDKCNRRQIVSRIVRLGGGPYIHYGTIGSANMIVKDACVRDELQKDMNILCVEMEAAGLMSNFPCLVIRGICDYADSHKNQIWQPYAAAVAAAYMKELLLAMPVRQVVVTEYATETHTSSFHFGLQLGQAPVIQSNLFIGRSSELQTMEEVLQPQNPPLEQGRLVLGGIGGVGKTQLAITYAKRHCNSYKSVFWLNATSEAELKQSLRLMAQQVLEVKTYEALNDEQILLHISRWLSNTDNTRWLLIFDNYDEPEIYDIWKYCSYTAHGSVIITSRLPDKVAAHQILVRPLEDIEHGMRILETRSGRDDFRTDLHAYRLAERLQGFPLALATAGAYLRQSTWTCERYLKEYDESRWESRPGQPLQLQDYPKRTLHTTWDVSYRRLQRHNANAAKLLKLLAYFDNRQIWYDLLRAGLNTNVPDWLRETVTSDILFESSMRILAEYCFVEAQWSSHLWSMHGCVHDWALIQLNQPLNPQDYWYTCDCIVALLRGQTWDQLRLVQHAPLVPHAVRLADERFSEIDGQLSEIRCNDMLRIASLLMTQLQYVPAEVMYIRTLASCEKAFGPNHDSTLSAISNLGLLYTNQDKLEKAEQNYIRALAGFEKVIGLDHPSTLTTIQNLGYLYIIQDKLGEAEEMFRRVLTEREQALGPDHPITLNVIENLNELYIKQGKYEQAEQSFIRTLAFKEKALGLEHTQTLRTVFYLGVVYHDQGKLEKSEKMYMRALAGYERNLGPNHTYYLYTLRNLGSLRAEQGKFDEAEENIRCAITGLMKVLGPEHRYTLKYVSDLEYVKARRVERESQSLHVSENQTFGRRLAKRSPFRSLFSWRSSGAGKSR